MAGPSFRDRFFTPKVWRAISSPWSILLAVVVAVVAAFAGLPVVAAVLLGVVAYAGRVLVAVPGAAGPRPERIDPFTVQEPWRRFVQDALHTRNRFDELVYGLPEGPLRDNLASISQRIHAAVEENYRVAQRGQMLAKARRTINVGRIDRQRAELAAAEAPAEPADPTAAGPDAAGAGPDASVPDTVNSQVAASLDAQRAAAERLDKVQQDAQARLRLLDARMDEALARAVELSAQSGSSADLGGLGADVDSLVTDMEALRQALEEVHGAGGGLASPGGSA
jgi:hypothetical protein